MGAVGLWVGPFSGTFFYKHSILEKVCCINFSGENVIDNVIHDLNEALTVKSMANRTSDLEDKKGGILNMNKWEVELNEDLPENLANAFGDDTKSVILRDEIPNLQQDGEGLVDDMQPDGKSTGDKPLYDDKSTVSDKVLGKPVKKKRGRKPKDRTITKDCASMKLKEKKLGKCKY